MKKQIIKKSEVGIYADYKTAVNIAISNNRFFKKTNQKTLFAKVDKNLCKVTVFKVWAEKKYN